MIKVRNLLTSIKPDGLKTAQILFLCIPLFLIFALCLGSANSSFERILEHPGTTSQMVMIFTYPFCYLFLKSIRTNLKVHKGNQLIPLWMLLLSQVLALNLLCTGLIAFGIYQEYGSDVCSFKNSRPDQSGRSSMLSFIPILLLYLFVLFVKWRTGMIL